MKLLGWMHRKIKQNFNEAAKNRTTAQTSFDDDQKYHAEPTTYGFSLSGNPNTTAYQKVSWNIKETEEEKPLNELFHGFLAIGTLGASEAFNTEPPTPTFPTSFEEDDVTHETTHITEQDLKLITKELEKFLESEEAASEDAQSSKRSSYASIITLSGKQLLDDDKTQDSAPTLLDCPLQKYFFGSSIIELSDADMAVKTEEASSEELEVLKGKCARDKKRSKAQFAKNFMKKMLKNLNSKSKTHAASSNGGSTDSSSIKKKFPKVLKMFKKKVHPERFIDEKESEKDEKRVIPIKGSRSDTGNIWFGQMMTPEEEYFESGRGGAFMENNEHWIKTDADYLVLEL